MCEADPELTITSVVGVNAADLISRRVLCWRIGQCGGLSVCPLFRPHVLWTSIHTINHGEGGEQGDALMPLLFSLGQHSGLEATHRQLRGNEKLFAYLDDVQAKQNWGSVHHS